ncbi:MAG TPA: AI-2E family transporter [Anaerolineae bacterium]|nr:AI-2E family transporter [Anaerolineae bacterium]HID85379.1 AI-2E family transporter [Anaerolineales bacterium]HIQ09339.1 AI-2E family transporter [Anaerolineaceae bacterium]
MRKPHAAWSWQTKWTVSLMLLALGVYLLTRFRELWPPLIVAVLLAYVLSWPVELLTKRFRLARGWATALVYLLLFAVLLVTLLVGVPLLVGQVQSLNLDVQRLILQAESILGQRIVIAGQVLDGQQALEQLRGVLQQGIEALLSSTLSIVVNVVSSVALGVFVLIISFYLVKDAPLVKAYLDSLPPPPFQEDYQRLRREISAIWGAFFRGQLTLAAVVGGLFTVIGLIVGLPGAIPMGILAGLLEFLPSLGHGIWLTLASLLAFFVGSTWLPLPNWAFAALIIGIHLIFQQVDINYLIPRIVGRRVHLHPMVVILGILAGAILGGVLGVLLASPTIASLRVLGRYVYARLFDLDPFPSPVSEPLPPPNLQWWQKRSTSRRRFPRRRRR